jgi:DNA-directed RNA polymerase specialized sigma subunit
MKVRLFVMNYFDSNNTNGILSLNTTSVQKQLEKQNYEEYLRKEKENSKEKNHIDYEHLENIFTNEIYFRAMKDLSKNEKLILYLYCYEYRTLNEICKILKKSKSEIIELRLQAVNNFKNNVEKYRKMYLKKNGGDLDE